MIGAEGLTCRLGEFALRAVDLTVDAAEHFVILGPPGSGKTVLLECLCGLRRIDAGRVLIGEEDVTALEPRRRAMGYVPQDYAILPHLSVEENIGFGLRVRGADRAERTRKVAAMTDMLKIGRLLGRRPQGLSGGEKQRVALARALILSPRVLLLDEPVSALDEATRQEICSEISRIQKRLGLTTLHVSHNLEEALSVADRAGILMNGEFKQIGTLDDLLRRPRTADLARFMRCGNIFDGQAESDGSRSAINVDSGRIIVNGTYRGAVSVVVRPENIVVEERRAEQSLGENHFPVGLGRASDLCNYVRVDLDGPLAMVAHLSPAAYGALVRRARRELIARLDCEQIHVIEESRDSPPHRSRAD